MPKTDSQRLQEVELELARKTAELEKYKAEISNLNSKLRDLIAQITNEIKTATVLQKALVPTEIKNIPGFEFSTKFVPSFLSGGDYFDIFEHEDKYRFGVMLASGSGHGMSALFLSVLMKLASAIESRKPREPGEALQAIAEEMRPNMQAHDTADLFYGLIDRRTMTLHYALCGDVCGLLFSSEENGIIRLKPTGPALTKDLTEAPITLAQNLESKDRLVIASRGIFSATNANGEEFGMKRLETCIFDRKGLGVHDLRNEVLFQVGQFTGKEEPDRDMTLLVLEVKERVIKLARQ